MDSDDEVRDRATFYLNVLQQRQLPLNAAYIFNGWWQQGRGASGPEGRLGNLSSFVGRATEHVKTLAIFLDCRVTSTANKLLCLSVLVPICGTLSCPKGTTVFSGGARSSVVTST